MRAIFKLSLCFLISLVLYSHASAGVVITGRGRGREQKVYLSGDSLRFDADGQPGIIFTEIEGSRRLIVIDRASGSYYEITAENVREIRNMLEQAEKMLEQAMQFLPEEQREEMESQIRERFGAAAAEREIVLRERGEKVNGWTADRYAVYLDGEKNSLVWFAGFGQFGLEPGDFTVLDEFEKFWEPLASAGAGGGELFFAGGRELGLPVRAAEIDEDGAETVVFSAKEVKREDLASENFDIPGGLERRRMPLMGR